MYSHPVMHAIASLFARGGGELYFDEAVTQQEHALQCACLAEKGGAAHALIVAALLHDVGHLLHGGREAAEVGRDVRHEDIGARWLRQFFGPDVIEPIRLHVDAKRYLCATEAGYIRSLSSASRRSLELQGGPFDRLELNQFVDRPHARDAVRLRLWDDAAKVPGVAVPPLDYYSGVVTDVAAAFECR